MPHTKSAEHKARLNRSKAGKRWAEYLSAQSNSIVDLLRASEINLDVILIYSHNQLKRHFVCSDRVCSDTQQFKTWREFEIHIVGYSHRESFTFSIPFERLSKSLTIQSDDINVSRSFMCSKNKAMTAHIQGIVYTWLHTQMMKHLSSRRSEKIREELVAAVWHPKRLAWRLEQGGWDAVEAFA